MSGRRGPPGPLTINDSIPKTVKVRVQEGPPGRPTGRACRPRHLSALLEPVGSPETRRLAQMATCPACGKENPDGFEFCGFCTAPLSAPAPTVGAKERKVVSVLFCDLVGFTAASESADPEEVQARIAPYHARTRERIEAFGGTVEKFIGDAVMAVFGAPTVHEDDPERAVRAALAIRDWAVDDGTFEVRLAVNTGEALVSIAARPEAGEGLVAGDVINTAARLQGAAPVN